MSIDPEELKVRRIKRDRQITEVQKYMEEQDEKTTRGTQKGRLDHRDVRQVIEPNKKISDISKEAIDTYLKKTYSNKIK